MTGPADRTWSFRESLRARRRERKWSEAGVRVQALVFKEERGLNLGFMAAALRPKARCGPRGLFAWNASSLKTNSDGKVKIVPHLINWFS